MAKRWLKFEVEKTHHSEVYVCIDDEKTPILTSKPRWAGGKDVISLTHELRKAGEDAAKELDSFDWGCDYEADYSASVPVEVTEAEAKEYGVFDATTGYEKNPAEEAAMRAAIDALKKQEGGTE